MQEEIRQELIKKCTTIFDGISSREADAFLGTPPRVFYIDFGFGEKQMFGGGAFLSFGAGPCYGRGYYYEIIHDEDGQRLGEEKMLWVS